MVTLIRSILPLLMILFLASCKLSTEPSTPEPEDPPTPRKVADDDYTELSDGLKYYDFVVGTGASAKNGDLVSVHYHGWLTDNTLFDSSYRREEPIVFQLGSGRVIQGWELGIAGMQAGGQRQLVIPPELAYGGQRRGPIPPNSTLVFEVELVAISN